MRLAEFARRRPRYRLAMLTETALGVRQATPTTRRTFRPDVEGLRAVAIGLVVLYHFDLGPFHGGYVGVDVFFVVSGFVITSMLLRERERSNKTSLGDFYARRVRRILPAAALVLVTTTIATFVWLGSVQGLATVGDARAAALFYSNYHFAAQQLNYFTSSQSPSPLVHFWSLSIEEQFYFVWPTLLLCACGLVRAIRRRATLSVVLMAVIGASFTYSVVLTPTNQTLAYYSSLTRAWELALGALVAVCAPIFERLPQRLAVGLSWLGFAGILVAGLTFTGATRFPGYAVALPVVATAMTISAGGVRLRSGAELVLGTRGFIWLGALSYSLYLWHWPIWAITTEDLGHEPPIYARVALLALAIGISFLSLRFVENPIRRNKALAARRRLSLMIGGSLILGSVLLVTIVGQMWPAGATFTGRPASVTSEAQLQGLLREGASISSVPPLVVPLDKVPSTEFPNANGCLVSDTTPTATGSRPAGCTFGDVNSATVVALYGDSQAVMWLPAFDKLGKEHHWRIVLYARAACRIADLKLWDYPLNAPGVGCTLWHAWSVRQIRQLHPRYVVIADHAVFGNIDYNKRPYSQAAFTAGMLATIDQIRQPRTSVVLLGPIPQPAQDPVTCLARNVSNVQACSTSLEAASKVVNLAEVYAVSLAANLPLIPTTQWFCTGSTCPTIVNHTVMYYDADHASEHYAAMLASLLGDALQRKAGL
jgi:peptidoglycan/LPS O-acetylase OafA/YrhL